MLELQSLGDPSRTLQGNSSKSSESVSGIFRTFLRKVPVVLRVWLKYPRERKGRKRAHLSTKERLGVNIAGRNWSRFGNSQGCAFHH